MTKATLALLGILCIFALSGCATTTLYQAVTLNDTPTVQSLIAGGTNADTPGPFGYTPLMAASMAGNMQLAQLLIDKGANVNYLSNGGDTALIMAAHGGKADVVSLLVEHGANVNSASRIGNTPLIMTGKSGSLAAAKLLYEKGAKLHAVNSNGDTPLTIAAKYGKAEVAKFFIEKGADLNHANKVGPPPVTAAAFNTATNADVIRIWENMNIETNNGSTPLILAASHGFTDTVKVLIASGADPDVKGNDGKTALDWANRRRHLEISRLLEANEAAKKLAAAAKRADEFEALVVRNDQAALKAYLNEHPDAFSSLKNPDMRLRFTGPAELRIADIAQMVKDGNKDSLVIAQINSVGGPYKEFSPEEMAALKKMNISDDVIAAMIAITTAYHREQKLLAAQKQTQPSPAPVQLVQQAQQPVQPQPAPESNTLPDCIKLAAALKACDMAGGFLTMGCKAVARSQFNCPGL